MALKRKISAADFEKLSDVLKAEYKKSGENYVLDTDDAEELLRARDREKEARSAAEAAKAKAETDLEDARKRLAEIEDEKARKGGDVAALEASWKAKLETERVKSEEKIGAYRGHMSKILVDNVAQSIAASISTAPAVILPHIKSRLAADFEGDTPTTRVLGSDGKVSALSVDDLKKEFIDNKEFASIIAGTKATGASGATNPLRKSGGSAAGEDTPLNRATPEALAARVEARLAAK